MNSNWAIETSLGVWILESAKVLAAAAITIATLKDGPSLGGTDVEKSLESYNDNLEDRIIYIYEALSPNVAETDAEEKDE